MNDRNRHKNRIKLSLLLACAGLSAMLLSGCTVESAVTGTIDRINLVSEKLDLPAIPTPVVVEEELPEVQPLEEDSFYRYYKTLLDAEENDLYEQIRSAVATRADSIHLEVRDLDRLLELAGYVRDDNPEYFWFTEGSKAVGYEKEGTYYIDLQFVYNCTEAEQTRYQKELDAVCNPVVAKLANLTDYEKVRGVYEYIINSTTYDESYTDQSCYSVLLHRRGVCAGYTNATNYLLRKLGVQTIYVSGTAKDQEHCWSLVKVNGSWYHLDTTWGDPVREDGQEVITYICFLTTDEDIKLDHTISAKTPKLPSCSSMGCNFYVWQGRYLDSMDYDYISRMLTDAASRKEVLEFKCSNQKVFEAIVNYLFTEDGLWTATSFAHYYYPNFDQYQVAYSIDEVHHVVRISPNYSDGTQG